jgi:hypothetical protein
VSKHILKRRGTPLYFSKDTFDSDPISVANRLRSEAESAECSLQVVRIIDENRHFGNRNFLRELADKVHSELRCSSQKEPYMEEFVRIWIDSSVQTPSSLS